VDRGWIRTRPTPPPTGGAPLAARSPPTAFLAPAAPTRPIPRGSAPSTPLGAAAPRPPHRPERPRPQTPDGLKDAPSPHPPAASMRRKGPWRCVASPSLTFGSSSGSLARPTSDPAATGSTYRHGPDPRTTRIRSHVRTVPLLLVGERLVGTGQSASEGSQPPPSPSPAAPPCHRLLDARREEGECRGAAQRARGRAQESTTCQLGY
jgi:hypothetical protein